MALAGFIGGGRGLDVTKNYMVQTLISEKRKK